MPHGLGPPEDRTGHVPDCLGPSTAPLRGGQQGIKQTGLTSIPSHPLSNAGASHVVQPCPAPVPTDPPLVATSVNHLKRFITPIWFTIFVL